MHQYLSNEIKDMSLNEKNITNTKISTNILRPQTTEIEISSILGFNNVYEIQKLFNPEASYIRNYIILDSRYRLITNTNTSPITQFQWSYVDNANITNTSVNSIGTIKNIVSMRLYQPRVPFVQTGTYNMNSETRRVSILINEFLAQSFIGPNDSRFHFILQPIIMNISADPLFPYYPNMIELKVEEFNDGKFSFRKPITTFDTLSVTFLDPVNVITFKHDRDTITFTYGNPTTITTSVPHLFNNSLLNTYGVISNFTTNSPVTDKVIIDAINNPLGLTLTVTGGSTFTFPINTTTITPTVGLVSNIYFLERRVVLPLEITYLESNK